MTDSPGRTAPSRDSGDPRRWRAWPVGTRVMVRTRLPEGSSHLYTDVLGTVLRNDDDGLLLRTRHGDDVEVPGVSIVTGKPVPPAPPRRAGGRTTQAG